MLSPSRTEELKLLPLNRFLESLPTVIVDATGLSPIVDPAREDARDGDSDGGGSFDLAECTRSSNFCIFPIRPRIWHSDPDFGSPGGRPPLVLAPLLRLFVLVVLLWVVWLDRGMLVRGEFVLERPLPYAMEVARAWAKRWAAREVWAGCKDRAYSPPEAFWRANPGVTLMDFRILDDDSEMGGDGGVAVAEASDILAGGVVNIEEEIVEVPGERSGISGVCGVDGLRCRDVCFLV